MANRKQPTPPPSNQVRPEPPPAPPTRSRLEELAERIRAMTPSDQLRIAAGFIEQGNYGLARPIVERIGGELALLALVRGSRT